MKRRSIHERFRHRIEYWMLLAAAAILRLLPRPVFYRIVRGLGLFAFHILRVRRAVTEENLIRAFGAGKTPEEIGRIARESYVHIGMTFAEAFIFPSFLGHVEEMADMAEAEELRPAQSLGKGLVLIGCHLGSWEMCGAVIGAMGLPLTVVAKSQSNPLVDEWINRTRERHDMKIVSRGAPVKHVVRALQKGEIVGLISDQDEGRRGIFADFFGRKASTPAGAAVLALRFKTPVIVCVTVRTTPGYYRFVSRPVEVRPDDTVQTLTERYSRVMEGVIRLYPEQYFWMHRRWKTQPPETPDRDFEASGGGMTL